MNQFHPIKFEVNEGETERQTNSHKRKRTKYRSRHKKDVLKSFAILQNFKKASFFYRMPPVAAFDCEPYECNTEE